MRKGVLKKLKVKPNDELETGVWQGKNIAFNARYCPSGVEFGKQKLNNAGQATLAAILLL